MAKSKATGQPGLFGEETPKLHKLQVWINENTPRVNKMDKPFTYEECEKLAKQFQKQVIKDVLTAMENHKPLTKKYVSAYRTALDWCKRANQGVPHRYDGTDVKVR